MKEYHTERGIRLLTRLVFIFAVYLLSVVGVVPGAVARDTYISGTVQAAEGGSLDGLVLIEKGRLYNKKFKYGGLIKNGRFSVKVDGGGTHGLHLYATGYVYFPLGIRVEAGKDNHGQYKLPPNPATARIPVISNIRFEPAEEGTRITLDVTDPDKDLSHQVLALNAATGEGFRMSPPGFVLPFTRTYPEGTYSLDYDVNGSVQPSDWYFVAADNKCYNSPVLGNPFTAEGIVPAKAKPTTGGDEAAKGSSSDGEKGVSGQVVYINNCSMCHLADSTRDKVGPGLKGLYKLDRTPTLKNPVTDEVIGKQIIEGGENMPPYSHLTSEEVRAVMDYLKTL